MLQKDQILGSQILAKATPTKIENCVISVRECLKTIESEKGFDGKVYCGITDAKW